MRLKSSRRTAPAVVLPLESRLLMAATTIDAAAQEAVINGGIPAFSSHDTRFQSIPLNAYFMDPNVPGTLVTFNTSKGPILVSLTDAATPATVASFLSYVQSGAYDNTIFHRSALDAQSTPAIPATDTTPAKPAVYVPISPSNPAGIIQGGGYVLASDGITHIPQDHYVPDEYLNRLYGDIPGTIAMAKTSEANSATTEWYFNNRDNTAGLDTPTTDSSGNATSYTVFGKVLTGMNVIDSIATAPTSFGVLPGSTSTNPTYTPITGLTQTQINNNAGIGGNNLVYTYNVIAQPGTTYTVTSTDPTLVAPTISNGVLTFDYAASRTGTAVVTVTATDVHDATSATQSFAVTVPSTTAVTAAPITAADTVTAVGATAAVGTTPASNGLATVIHPLTNDTVGSGDLTANTDAAGHLIPAALNAATVTIVTAPAHGTATVDPTTGDITYTATLDAQGHAFVGADALSYTVTDSAGHASAATAVTVNVIAAPRTVTIGAGSTVKAIQFTQPGGGRAQLSVGNATAVVTFSAGDLTVTPRGGTDVVTGAGATVARIDVTNKGKAGATLTATRLGKGTVTLGDIADADQISQLTATGVTLTGAVSAKSIRRLIVGSTDGATITANGDTAVATVASIGTAVNTSLAVAALTSLTGKSWTITDGGSHVVTAAAIGTLSVTGAFADSLNVTSASGYAITTANVTAASGEWDVAGPIRKATLTKPTASFVLSDGSVVQTLRVVGDLTGNVIAAVIDDMSVTGAMTGASVQTDALFNAAETQLLKLSIGGAVTNSVIASSGNIGTVTAKSLTASRIYAGATTDTINHDALPTSAAGLSATATIKSVALGGGGKATFSSSEIAAYAITRLALGRTPTANGGTGFGVSAHTLASLSADLNPGGPLVLTKAQTKTAATLATYLAKHKRTLGDLVVQLY